MRRKHPKEPWSVYLWMTFVWIPWYHVRCLWYFGVLRRKSFVDWRGRIKCQG